jgi:Peptidase U49
VPLPTWLPNISEIDNIQHAAVRELWVLAIVWMLLHEFQHIAFKEQNRTFCRSIDEELACDKAAFDWLLAHVDEFATASNQPADKVRAKRGMGALIALFCIVWLSERDTGSSHPPAIQRLAILLEEIGEKDAGRFWEFAAGLIFVVDNKRQTIAFPRPDTIRDIVLALGKGLARGGPEEGL